jgi:hypothetical protein
MPERAGDDCADTTCYNPGSLKLPVIHRYDCAGTKFTVRVIRKIPVPVCKSSRGSWEYSDSVLLKSLVSSNNIQVIAGINATMKKMLSEDFCNFRKFQIP